MKIIKALIFGLGIVFLIIALLSLVTFSIIKHLKIKDLVEQELEHELGIKVTIDKLEFSPLLAHIAASGVTIHNPPGFVEDELAYISAINLVFDPIEMVTRSKPEIYLVGLDLARLNIVRNNEGKVNIKELSAIKKEPGALKDPNPFYFDVLVLSVGEVNYTVYTVSGKKTTKYTIGLKDQAFVNLQDESSVIRLVVYKALQNTDIAKLINLTITPIFSNVSDTVNAAWGTAKTGMKGILEITTLPFKLIFNK